MTTRFWYYSKTSWAEQGDALANYFNYNAMLWPILQAETCQIFSQAEIPRWAECDKYTFYPALFMFYNSEQDYSIVFPGQWPCKGWSQFPGEKVTLTGQGWNGELLREYFHCGSLWISSRKAFIAAPLLRMKHIWLQ